MNYGAVNNAGPAQTELSSTVPLNPANVSTGTLLVANTNTGSAVVAAQTGTGSRPAFVCENAAGIGVSGDSETGTGVVGSSASGDGVHGTGKTGVVGKGAAVGVQGDGSGWGGNAHGIGVLGIAGQPRRDEGGNVWQPWAGRFRGDVRIEGDADVGRDCSVGNDLTVWGGAHVAGSVSIGSGVPATLTVVGALFVFGLKLAVVPHPDGSRRGLYSLESPESWFEDFGRASLSSGKAHVDIDPDFAAVADLEGDYHVFVTPEGDSNGLYVSGMTSSGFDVTEQLGGSSAIDFSYRVVARRKDVDADRFPRIDVEEARVAAADKRERFRPEGQLIEAEDEEPVEREERQPPAPPGWPNDWEWPREWPRSAGGSAGSSENHTA
jgi:hypothetical protein